MRVFFGEFVIAVLHAEVLLIPQVYKPIIAAPAVRVDYAFAFYWTT